jgi:hypothetical protein
MTDRELLEFAAKAARATWIDDSWPQDLPGLMLDFGNGTTQWNPLDDDGDALRLAVKLRCCVDVDFDRVDVSAQLGSATEYLYDLPSPTDPLAATRRAIVRAAAEIGRNKT